MLITTFLLGGAVVATAPHHLNTIDVTPTPVFGTPTLVGSADYAAGPRGSRLAGDGGPCPAPRRGTRTKAPKRSCLPLMANAPIARFRRYAMEALVASTATETSVHAHILGLGDSDSTGRSRTIVACTDCPDGTGGERFPAGVPAAVGGRRCRPHPGRAAAGQVRCEIQRNSTIRTQLWTAPPTHTHNYCREGSDRQMVQTDPETPEYVHRLASVAGGKRDRTESVQTHL